VGDSLESKTFIIQAFVFIAQKNPFQINEKDLKFCIKED
jgi:hypothetical protein